MKKTPGPLRLVVDRVQSFQSTGDYPHGWINEHLECGHVHKEVINPDRPGTYWGLDKDGKNVRKPIRHRDQTTRRRCADCLREDRV